MSFFLGNAVVAESALDRMACGLGGKTVFPHILSTTPQMLQNPDWKWRHAALMAISATGEGCHKQMVAYLDQIMNGVMNYINDPVSLNPAFFSRTFSFLSRVSLLGFILPYL